MVNKIKKVIKATPRSVTVSRGGFLYQPSKEALKEPLYNQAKESTINNPSHYGGKDNPYEAIKVIKACSLDFNTGNAVKYILRAGKKDPSKEIEDLKKAIWYLQDKVNDLEKVK